MTDKLTVWPVFFDHSIEVDPDEAQSLERSGLLRAGPIDTPQAEPETVTVVPVFTGRPMQVSAEEAESLDQAGLLMHDQPQGVDQQQHEDESAGEQAPGSEQETE